jgi:nucleoside-diphosphate-sugar epimerase
MSIYLTGSTGFVGTNLMLYLQSSNYKIEVYNRSEYFNINNKKIIIHLAGISHDTKKSKKYIDYYNSNTLLTIKLFDQFLISDAKIFIFLSSVKAAADSISGELTEIHEPNPSTYYGKTKFLAEQYILSKNITKDKRVYILRPCMIHGPNNKGNLNLLYNFIKLGVPWPLGAYKNKRSFCSIENLCFIIKELLENDSIPSGIYNIADSEVYSTNQLVKLISKTLGRKTLILCLPKFFVNFCAIIGDIFNFSFNSEALSKLTESYIVSNKKILSEINKKLPISSTEGLLKTINSL